VSTAEFYNKTSWLQMFKHSLSAQEPRKRQLPRSFRISKMVPASNASSKPVRALYSQYKVGKIDSRAPLFNIFKYVIKSVYHDYCRYNLIFELPSVPVPFSEEHSPVSWLPTSKNSGESSFSFRHILRLFASSRARSRMPSTDRWMKCSERL
jgi:hypothetical protein